MRIQIITIAFFMATGFGCATQQIAENAATEMQDMTTTEITTPAETANDAAYTGDWMLNIKETPLGDVQGILTIETNEDQEYAGYITINGADFPLKTINVEDDKIAASFFHAHYGMNIKIDLLGAASGPLKGRMNNEYFTIAERI